MWIFSLFVLAHAENVLRATSIVLENGQTVNVKAVDSEEVLKYSEEFKCNVPCAANCVSFSQGISTVNCISHCGCQSLFSNSIVAQPKAFTKESSLGGVKPSAEEKIKWWVSIHSKKMKNYETCHSECGTFCEKINGDQNTCIEKCASKFCKEPPSENSPYLWKGVSIVSAVIAFVILKSLMNKYLINKKQEFVNIEPAEYKRI